MEIVDAQTITSVISYEVILKTIDAGAMIHFKPFFTYGDPNKREDMLRILREWYKREDVVIQYDPETQITSWFCYADNEDYHRLLQPMESYY